MNKKNNRKGFTTVELVIVIAVIAILATVLIPTFSGLISNANESTYLQAAKNAHSYYVSEFDYVNNGTPKTDIVITVRTDANELIYFVVDGNQFVSEAYESEEDALEVFEEDYELGDEIETPDSVGDNITFYSVKTPSNDEE